LLLFWLALDFLPVDMRPWIDRVFYAWSSVFALFVVTVFWGLMSDCFDNNQAKRLFGFIAVGSSLGGSGGECPDYHIPGVFDRTYHQVVGCWSDTGYHSASDGLRVRSAWPVSNPGRIGGCAGYLQSRALWPDQTGAIALTAVPVAGAWAVLALKLGSRQEDLATVELREK
jgi:hypothetical protein